MKPNTRLSSAVFQLTPTRTRCDLIIIANDKREKIASGLLNPFLSHLKTAQDQISKGGYSILLEPSSSGDATWFTKATLERFVRFVSTPEILERVYTIETEILQIDEAMVMQSHNGIGQSSVEGNQQKHLQCCEGNESVPDSNEEKAIVIYKPDVASFEANEPCLQEGNSKVQLLKILETRKTVLQKEQGMAFARAVAAGFDIDHMASLMSFCDSFGAMRLLEACSRFTSLWKSKHESGQWLDIEASEVLPTRSDIPSLNASGITLSSTPGKNDKSNHEVTPEVNGNLGSTNNADTPGPPGQQEYFHGQFPLIFPSWPMHTPPGVQPLFPAYPVQGTPYYQAYSGNVPFFQPPNWPMDHSPGNQAGQKRQSSDGNNTSSETDIDRRKSLGDTGSDTELPFHQKSNKKSGGSNKKQSGMVVIKNINYIAPKENKSGSESDSVSNSDTDTEHGNFEAEGKNVIHQSSRRPSKSKGSHMMSFHDSNISNSEVSKPGSETNDTHWQAFETCLLRGSDEDASADDKGMFSVDNNVKRRANGMIIDPQARDSQNPADIQDDQRNSIHRINESAFCRPRGSGDDFIIGSQQNQLNHRASSHLQNLNYFEGASSKMDEESSHGMVDETLIAPLRSMSIDQVGTGDRSAIDMGSEIPSQHQKLGVGNKNRFSYEPDGLSLMPVRETDENLSGYDLALDYQMQVCTEGSRQKRVKEITNVKGGFRKSDKDQRLNKTLDALSTQRTGGPIRKAKSSKMNPLEDARARAEKLRSYKTDLQKMKKEKEAAELRRIEALKQERQKRIADRVSSTISAKPSTLSPHMKQLPAKLSPVTNKGTKFSDTEPASSSPLQRSRIRTAPGVNEPLKTSKASKLSEGGHMAANRLTRSSSSLSEPKRESNGVTLDSKASMARIRRLSEPRTITTPAVTYSKARSIDSLSKRRSEGPERNKISAIINLDRSKAAALPELKIKTPKVNLSAGENLTSVTNKQKVNGLNPSTFSKKTELNVNNSSSLQKIDADDSPIVEKTVVMLEYEKPSFPIYHSSEGKLEMGRQHYNDCDKGVKSVVMSKSDAISDPPTSTRGVENDISQPPKKSNYNEVKTSYSEHGKAPLLSSKVDRKVEETVKTHVPDVRSLKLEKTSGTLENITVKEPSKGFKRLLKFGKKNHTSSSMDQNVDGMEQHDNARNTASSSEAAYALKNLISEDESSTAGNASQKLSRHFSLLSPFWSKSSEKKHAS